MKEGWEIIPFEDCIQKVKYTTKIQGGDYLPSGKYPIVSQEEGLISGFWNNESDVFKISSPIVVFGDHTRILKYIDFDFVLGADGVKILCPIKSINAKFLYYYLHWYKVPSLGYSRHYKLLKEINLPVPSIAEQEQIVAELDLLSSVIEKKKEQLKELDNLAQSIFYDMFGDPITNEKGWKVKRLEDCMTLLNGRAYKQDELLNNGKYPVLRVGNFFSNNEFYYSNLELDDEKYCDNGDLLYAWSASFGPKIWDGEKVIYHYHIWKVIINETMLNKTFAFALLANITASLKDEMHGATMMHLTKCGMEKYIIPTPPLSLQETFAEQYKMIEQQKSLIRKSIEEAEALFNSRMDYYFN